MVTTFPTMVVALSEICFFYCFSDYYFYSFYGIHYFLFLSLYTFSSELGRICEIHLLLHQFIFLQCPISITVFNPIFCLAISHLQAILPNLRLLAVFIIAFTSSRCRCTLFLNFVENIHSAFSKTLVFLLIKRNPESESSSEPSPWSLLLTYTIYFQAPRFFHICSSLEKKFKFGH